MTETDDLAPSPYARAVSTYWRAGWRAPLPLPPKRKDPPPNGYTGYQGPEPSYPDILDWVENGYRTRVDGVLRHVDAGNICLRLPSTVIGIDVDAYEPKTGAQTLAHSIELYGPLPATWRTTSREDGISGIRLYRVPENTILQTVIDYRELNISGIEILQRHHRYAIVWPSVHDKTGATYRWIAPDGMYADPGTIPAIDDLPALPQEWLTGLAARAHSGELPSVDVARVLESLPGGVVDEAVAERLSAALVDLGGGGGSRHDVTRDHVLAFLRFAEQERSGVRPALELLHAAFVSAVTADGSRSPAEARSEFGRMLTNARGHQLIAGTPTAALLGELTITARAVAQSTSEGSVSPAPPVLAAGDVVHNDDSIYKVFWTSRESLDRVRQWAWARMCSPWAVLGVVLARALCTVPPAITLPPIIGGPGSLNLFVALVGTSGDGKGSAESCGAAALPTDVHEAPAGSGEGLAHQYAHREKNEVHQDRTSVLFSIPEVDTLTAIGGRQGGTIMSKLRSAFSGEEIGFSYADKSRQLLIGRHNYRMCLILGVQPERAHALLQDAAGGTPQRFVWLPADDPDHPDDPVPEPPPLWIRPGSEWSGYRRHLPVPDVVRDTVVANRRKRLRGEGDALDGHALFVREKVAFALTLVDGRATMTDEDWALAGIVMAKSDDVRNRVVAAVTDAVDREALERGRVRDVEQEGADARRITRISRLVLAHLEFAGEPMTTSALSRKFHSRDRVYVEEALVALLLQNRIRQVADNLLAVVP